MKIIYKEGLWYFAHPYTQKGNLKGEENNFELACIRSNELLKKGYLIYSPIVHSHPLHIRDIEFVKNKEYKLWVDLDNRIIEFTKFKGIILAPNWQTSKGCSAEYILFKKKGLKILFYEDL